MVRLSNHGGGCCGAYHLHNFNTTENEDPDRINNVLREETYYVHPMNFAVRTNRKSLEVILNKNQCLAYPNVIKRLAELGFILTSSWINSNHGRRLFRFERCGNRKPISLDSLPFNWPENQIINAEMQGLLPGVPVTGGHYEVDAGQNFPIDHQENEQPLRERIVAKVLFYNRYRNNALSGGYLTKEEALTKNTSRNPRVDRLEVVVNPDGTIDEVLTENV